MIRCENLRFSYSGESFRLEIGRFAVEEGETVALVGPSGCGKTTLLNLISGILVPEHGDVVVNGKLVNAMTASERQRFRIGTIGQVPQSFELLDYLTIRENILVPGRVSSAVRLTKALAERCEDLAERTGILPHLDKLPHQLSQGERQRAALCRGLVTSPRLVLADEPTGNLDPENQDRIVTLLLGEAERLGSSVVMITHDPSLLPRFGRVEDIERLRKGGAS